MASRNRDAIKIGLTDGVSTEVDRRKLQEGELAITSETLTAASKSTIRNRRPDSARTTNAGAGGRRN